ncbi:MAG TPA: PilN domain-containing protein [Burkholderiales bacterium]|nr:PilN domain-containing protein [Burkholderiales bacterium]
MIRINLLPHRVHKRKARERQFYFMTGLFAGLGMLIVFFVHGVISARISYQQERNQYLEKEITLLDKQIDEIKKLKEQIQVLLARKKVVESLQTNRSETVHLLDQLVRQLPDGVYLKSVKQKGSKVDLTGLAQTNARVSTLLRNLESSPWFEFPNLVEIKAVTQGSTRLNEFNLNFTLSRGKQEAQVAKPGAKVNRP